MMSTLEQRSETAPTILTPHTVNGLELLIDLSTGEVFTSQSGLARLCGKARSTIQHWVIAENISNQRLKVKLERGLSTAEVYAEDVIATALEKYNPKLLIQCQKAGLRIFLHGLVGLKYELKVEEREAITSNSTPKAFEAAKYSREIEKLLGETQPRLAQYLIDHCINEVLGGDANFRGSEESPALPYESTGLLGVVEIAEKMNLPVNIHNRSELGKFVKSRLGHMAKIEKRLCNGRLADIAVYPECELVKQVIEIFFGKYFDNK